MEASQPDQPGCFVIRSACKGASNQPGLAASMKQTDGSRFTETTTNNIIYLLLVLSFHRSRPAWFGGVTLKDKSNYPYYSIRVFLSRLTLLMMSSR